MVGDCTGWRQADTATMAERFLEPGARLLAPRIRWGGAGSGVVESELALFPWLMSIGQRYFGVHDAVGQVLATILVSASAVVLFSTLRRQFSVSASALGVAAMLSTRVIFLAATAVQPEALCLLLTTGAYWAWVRWSEEPSRRAWLVPYLFLGAVACMVKPTAVQLPLALAIPVLANARLRAHSIAFFTVSGTMAAALLLYFLHARSLYAESGNTFGILSGGDSKLPHLRHLLKAHLWAGLFENNLRHGFGYVGALALAWSIARKEVSSVSLGALAAALLWGVVSFRYSTYPPFGIHYTLLAAFVGALLVAELSNRLSPRLRLLLASAILIQGLLTVRWRQHSRLPSPIARSNLAAGKALAGLHPVSDALVIVRAPAPRRDEWWGTDNNYQDPSVFHLARVRGWSLPRDEDSPHLLDRWRQQGAVYVVEPGANTVTPNIGTWLRSEARPVASTKEGGTVWALGPRTPPSRAERMQ